MAYVTPERVRAILVADGGATPSTTDKSTPASMTDEQLQVAIDDAEALVEATLAARYTMPINPAPKLLTTLSGAYAAYYATLTFRKTKDLEERDPAELRMRQARRILEDLREGTISLPGVEDDGTGSAIYNRGYEGDLWDINDFDVREVDPYRGWI